MYYITYICVQLIQIQIQYVLFIKVRSGMYHQRPSADIEKLTHLRYHPNQYLQSFGICASFWVFREVSSFKPSDGYMRQQSYRHWFRRRLVAWSAQAFIWTNAGVLLIGTFRANIQCNLERNSYIFVKKIAFENVVFRMAGIVSRP